MQPLSSYSINYLGPNRLLQGNASKIDPKHQEWYLHQAILLSELDNPLLEKRTKDQIALAILNGYSKAVPIDPEQANQYNINVTVLETSEYHRLMQNPLLNDAQRDFEKDMGLKNSNELLLVHSHLFKDVIKRDFPAFDFNLNVKNKLEFGNLIEQLIDSAIQNLPFDSKLVVDISKFLLPTGKIHPKDIEKLALELEDVFWKLVEQQINNVLQDNKRVINIDDLILIWTNIEKLRDQLQVIAFSTHKKQSVLLIPLFLNIKSRMPTRNDLLKLCKYRPLIKIDLSLFFPKNMSEQTKHDIFIQKFNEIIGETGYRTSPDQTKKAWLRVKDLKTIMKDKNLPLTQLATKGKISDIPQIFKSYSDLLKNSAMEAFKEITNSQLPFLRIMTKATVNLLNGLNDLKIDEAFSNKKLSNLLQIFYFRLINAIKDASLRKEDEPDFDKQPKFYNHLETIHQIIQDILTIVRPYKPSDFDEIIRKKITGEKNPVIPPHLNFQSNLMLSGMHCVTSVFAAAEKQKGTNKLNVVALKDSYYESGDMVEHAKTHEVSFIDGDKFKEKKFNEVFDAPVPVPIDIFFCEFHHNLSHNKVKYQTEDVLGQIKYLYKNNLVAEKFTLVLDTTIDLERSEDVRNFLADTYIQMLIKSGKLNVVLLRSAQKFDMFGMANFYGGVSTSINNQKSFHIFNERMNIKEDQLSGVSYQGMCHLLKYGSTVQDEYRKVVMENTQRLYKQLPKTTLKAPKNKNPMQIAQIDDQRSVFLAIEFDKEFFRTAKAFNNRINRLAIEENIPLTTRNGFGFPNTNMTIIDNFIRFTPGLEDKEIMDIYATFFKKVQNIIEKSIDDFPNISSENLDALINLKIQTLSI